MKVLLVADREELRILIERELSLRGADLVHYWHPIKAMDNIEETAPELVIFSGRDFPRHWKPFLVYFRAYSQAAAMVPFVLLHGENFPEDEQKKADYLKVDAVIPESFPAKKDLQILKDIASMRGRYSYRPSAEEKAEILFAHPGTMNLVQGRIEEISTTFLSFLTIAPQQCDDCDMPVLVENCSLSIFRTFITVDIEITKKVNNSFKARIIRGGEEIAENI